MKTIRKSVFESNSSSSHSFSIDLSYSNKESVKDVEITCGEFGWEYKKFNDFQTKTSYFWTLVHENPSHDLFERLTRLSQKYRFGLLHPRSSEYCYVDHGTEHYCDWVTKHPEIKTDEGLMDFLISESGWIFLGNDNEDGPPNFQLTPHQNADAPFRLILTEDPKYNYALPDNSESTIERFAETAAYNYLNKDELYDSGFIKIISIKDGVIEACREEYDYRTEIYTVTETYTLHYTIETKNL